MNPEEILDFWFKPENSQWWFEKIREFDVQITMRFEKIFDLAINGDLKSWRKTAAGRLAEVIVLDQFPRNMFRGLAKSFSGDAAALDRAKEAVIAGADKELEPVEKSFLYLPYMHSENMTDHDEAIKLFSQPGLEGNLKFEYMHRKILEQFGRYPHRNKILGRTSTPAELEFLKGPGSSF